MFRKRESLPQFVPTLGGVIGPGISTEDRGVLLDATPPKLLPLRRVVLRLKYLDHEADV